MKISRAALALALIAGGAQAATFLEPAAGYGTIRYDQSFTLNWSGDGSSLSIGLAHGPKNNVQEVTSLNGGYVNYPTNSFTYRFSKGSIPAGPYTFTITTEKAPINYSSSFCLETCSSSDLSPSNTEKIPESTTWSAGDPVIATATPSATLKVGESSMVVPTAEKAKSAHANTSYALVNGTATTSALDYSVTSGSGSTGGSEGGTVLAFTGGAAGITVATGALGAVVGVVGGLMMLS